MTPRLLVVCLGGLAGTGALVCCDLDAGTEAEASAEGEPLDGAVEEPEVGEGDVIH